MTIASFQEIIESIENLSLEDQDYLFDLIKKRRIEKRRSQIANTGRAIVKEYEEGKIKPRTAEEVKAYLLADEEE